MGSYVLRLSNSKGANQIQGGPPKKKPAIMYMKIHCGHLKKSILRVCMCDVYIYMCDMYLSPTYQWI